MASLEQIVLEKINIVDYYNTRITKLDNKYRRGISATETGLCPFHGDRDPSLGIMKDKTNKKIQLYHCFGCGAAGNVIKMHMHMLNKGYYRGSSSIIQSNGAFYTYEEALEDLAKSEGIEYSEVTLNNEQDINNEFVKRRIEITKCMSKYTIRDLEREMLNIRLTGISNINRKIAINRSLVRYMKENIEELNEDEYYSED